MAINYDDVRTDNVRLYGEDTDHLALLSDLYTDRGHFIFELLQNAEDADSTKVRFTVFADRLEILNNGRVFSEPDIRGICSIGKGTKAGDRTQIGKFGIGFKSVYSHTEQPEVHSGTEHFRIEHYVRPHAVSVREIPSGWTTLFVLPFNSPDVSFKQIASRLERLDARALLFLKSIHEVDWSVEGGHNGLFIRESEPAGSAKAVRILGQRATGETDQDWLLFERQLPVEWYAQELEVPEQKRLRVEVAFRLRKQTPTSKPEIAAVRPSPLVAFFPVEKEPTNLGFLLQGPYRTKPTRETVPPDDDWNRRLMGETAELVAAALNQLRDGGLLTVATLQILPIRAEDFPKESMFRPVFDRVRSALITENLLPTQDQDFVCAKDAKLARGAELCKLLNHEQLSQLYGPDQKWKWLSDQITENRTRDLHDYLIEELKIEEVRPETLAGQLEAKFLEGQSDEWVIRFYKFLTDLPALWRYPSSIFRNKPIVRLESGTHLLPFREGGAPNAYIPSGEGTDLPTVKGTIVAEKEACEFLRGLGLTEPDPVAEVIERVLPKYANPTSVSDEEHQADLHKILTSLRQASQERRHQLVQTLKSCRFLRARNCHTSDVEFKRPTEVYFLTEDLQSFFNDNPDAWFLDEPAIDEKAIDSVKTLGVKAEPLSPCQLNSVGSIVLRAWWGDHARGLNGFDSRCDIHGLDHALNKVSSDVAEYLWNFQLPAHRRHIHGLVQRSSRQNYDPSSTKDEYSITGKLLAERAWLPDRSGALHKPAELALADLPEAFNRDEDLAHWLDMKPALPAGMDQDTLLRAAGLAPEVVRLVQENSDVIEFLAKRPEVFERIRNEFESATEDNLKDPTSFDFRAELTSTFSRPAQTANSEPNPDEEPSAMPNPGRRRQKTREEIDAARGCEPNVNERFSRVPRKIWEAKNNSVREFLKQQYQGRCQICQETFSQRDGHPYFEGVYLVSRTRARWVDRYGNVLCLCANCSAKFLHGELIATSLLQQIDAFRPLEEGGSAEPSLQVILCGQPTTIRFSERHLLDLQQLAHETSEDSVADGLAIATNTTTAG